MIPPVDHHARSFRLVVPFALAAALTLGLSFAFAPERLADFPTCPLRLATDRPCPACGLGRGLSALSHARPADAWRYHPFSFPAYAVAWALVLAPLMVRRFPERFARGLRSAWLSRVAVGAVAALLAFGAWRWIGGSGGG